MRRLACGGAEGTLWDTLRPCGRPGAWPAPSYPPSPPLLPNVPTCPHLPSHPRRTIFPYHPSLGCSFNASRTCTFQAMFRLAPAVLDSVNKLQRCAARRSVHDEWGPELTGHALRAEGACSLAAPGDLTLLPPIPCITWTWPGPSMAAPRSPSWPSTCGWAVRGPEPEGAHWGSVLCG